MKYDLFIKTLERGRDVGFGRKFNISDILKKEFPKPTITNRETWNSEIEIQLDVLRDMQISLKIIKFDSLEGNKIFWSANQNNPDWFDNTTFDVWVTVTGLDYLNQYYLRQSNFSLNGILESSTKLQSRFDKIISENSVIQATASQKQTGIFRWTALFAFGAMGIAAISLWKDFNKDKLQQQLLQKDSLIQQLQKTQCVLKTDTFRQINTKKASPKKK